MSSTGSHGAMSSVELWEWEVSVIWRRVEGNDEMRLCNMSLEWICGSKRDDNMKEWDLKVEYCGIWG